VESNSSLSTSLRETKQEMETLESSTGSLRREHEKIQSEKRELALLSEERMRKITNLTGLFSFFF
jgi:predicted RNase H-like nuclease (RuvC/YqgF family)